MNGEPEAKTKDQPARTEFGRFFKEWWAFITGIGEFLALIFAVVDNHPNWAWALGIIFVLTMLAANRRLYKIAKARDETISTRNGELSQLREELAKAKSPAFTATAQYIIRSVEKNTREGIIRALDYAARCSQITEFANDGLRVRDIDSQHDGAFVIALLPESGGREFSPADKFYLKRRTAEGRHPTVAEITFNAYGTAENIAFFAVDLVHDSGTIDRITKSTALARVGLADELRVVPVFDVAELTLIDMNQVKKVISTIFAVLEPGIPEEKNQ